MGKGQNPLKKIFGAAVGMFTGGRVLLLSGLRLHQSGRLAAPKKLQPLVDDSFLIALPGAKIVSKPQEDQGVTTFRVVYEGKVYDATKHPDGSIILENDYETIEVCRTGADFVVMRTAHGGDAETELVQDDGKFIERRYADGFIERSKSRHYRPSRVEPSTTRQQRQDFKIKLETRTKVGRSVLARKPNLKVPIVKVDETIVTPPEAIEASTQPAAPMKAAAAPVLQGAQLQTSMPLPADTTHEISAVRYTDTSHGMANPAGSSIVAAPAGSLSPSSTEVVREEVARHAMHEETVRAPYTSPVVPVAHVVVEGDRPVPVSGSTSRAGANPFKLTRTSNGVVMSTEGVIVPPGAVPVPVLPINAQGMTLAFSSRVIANSMITLRVQPRFAGLIANILARLRGGEERGLRTQTKHQLPAPLAHTIKPDAVSDREAVERPNKSKESDDNNEEHAQRGDQDDSQQDDEGDDAHDDDTFVFVS